MQRRNKALEDKKAKKPEDLFGKVNRLPATGGHVVSKEKLLEPCDDEDAVATVFCIGCGEYTKVSDIGSKNLASKSEIELPVSLEGNYFRAERCIMCDDDYKKVSLSKIE